MTGTSQNDDELSEYDCRTLEQGRGGRVGITSRAHKDWVKLDVTRKSRVARTFREWCEGRRLPSELYKVGGRYGKTAGGVTICVFKARQLRLYGFERHLDEIRTFIIADCDPSKKQDDADQDLIDRLKVRIDTFGRGKKK